jgi:hypothetical protein
MQATTEPEKALKTVVCLPSCQVDAFLKSMVGFSGFVHLRAACVWCRITA